MDELLASVLDAHGGLESWNRLTKLTARLSVGGPFRSGRGWPGVYANQTVTVDAHRQHISFAPFTAPDRVSVLDVDPERVTIQTTDGEIVEERTDPRSSYPLPFDRSKTNANHNPDQVFYVDENFMHRRMDYSPDVMGNPPVAHYIHDPKTFDGFVFPTRRLIHLRDADGIADQTFATITINVEPARWSTGDDSVGRDGLRTSPPRGNCSRCSPPPRLRHTHFLPGGTAFAETLRCAIVAPGSPKHVTARPATA